MAEDAYDSYADDDPEYENDAAADIDAQLTALTPSDPATMPPDEGDAGHAEPPGDEG